MDINYLSTPRPPRISFPEMQFGRVNIMRLDKTGDTLLQSITNPVLYCKMTIINFESSFFFLFINVVVLKKETYIFNTYQYYIHNLLIYEIKFVHNIKFRFDYILIRT